VSGQRPEPSKRLTEGAGPPAPDSSRDVLLLAALDELRVRNEQLQAAHAVRESELREAVRERTRELETAREAAAREHERLRDVLESLHEGIVTVSGELEVEFANSEAKRLFAPASMEAGCPLPDPWPGLPLRRLAASLFGANPQVDEIRVSPHPGQALTVTGLPARGRPSAILVVADITARERRELAERDFVINAAHELRTPLTALSGAVEVLQGGAKDDPEQRDFFLGHLERECGRLGRLTAALLVLARAQMGVESPRLEVVEVRALLDRIGAELQPATGVRVQVSCPPDLAAFGHRELLEQALANLATNAVKHTRRGTISLTGAIVDERRVALEVVDTGVGMRPEDRARATERFYRAGGEPGFGLGLSIAASAATALGGTLELESARRRGTRVRIVLQAARLLSDG
jgi:two-component system phosphate regulon sensor histidine kinase PhoR